MKTTINYTNKLTPYFDAVEDCKFYLGDRWDDIYKLLIPVKDQRQFTFALGLVGITGFPVKAMYNLINGSDAWID